MDDRSRHWRNQVAVVAIDPLRGYQNALVSRLRRATVTIDHFHAIKLANAAIDAAGSGPSYSYDGAGRLTQAVMPGVTYNYGYGTTTTCPANGAGADTNRTSLVVTGTGAGTTNYCYDNADRLTSTTSAASGTITYDTHGNMIRDGNQSFTYNSSDQLVQSETPANVSLYQPDPLNRVAQRTTITKIVPGQTTITKKLVSTPESTDPLQIGHEVKL